MPTATMSKKERYQNRIELLQGTLDMLILQTLQWGPQHGYGISQSIQGRSREILQVETGSLYPALHRLEKQGWVTSQWKQTASHQRAKFYRLTPAGKTRGATTRSPRLPPHRHFCGPATSPGAAKVGPTCPRRSRPRRRTPRAAAPHIGAPHPTTPGAADRAGGQNRWPNTGRNRWPANAIHSRLPVTIVPDVVVLERVSLTRDGRPTLGESTGSIRDGERWIVLGPNGAGKTTLLKSRACTCILSAGRVTVLGAIARAHGRPAAPSRRSGTPAPPSRGCCTPTDGASGGGDRPERRARPVLGRRRAPRTSRLAVSPARSGGCASSSTTSSGRSPRASASGCRSPAR